MKYIYKFLSEKDWEQFQNDGHFQGSTLDLNDGFIHCAYEHQLGYIFQKYFKNEQKIFLLKLNIFAFSPKVKVLEELSSHGEKFPHIYGFIALDSVAEAKFYDDYL